MSYYGSFVLQCYVLRMRVITSTVGGNLTNRPPALRRIHFKRKYRTKKRNDIKEKRQETRGMKEVKNNEEKTLEKQKGERNKIHGSKD